MTWYVIDMQSTRHAISAEFAPVGFRWGVSESKHPVSLVQITAVPTDKRSDALRLVNAMNRPTALTS